MRKRKETARNAGEQKNASMEVQEPSKKDSQVNFFRFAQAKEVLGKWKVFSVYTFVASIRKYFLNFLALGMIVCLTVSIFNYVVAQRSASVTLSLNYESASQGKNPDGTRFMISDFRSTDVLQDAIERAGMADEIDAATLASCIRVQPTVQKLSTDSGSFYISTAYQIALTLPAEYRLLISPENMLDWICKTYRERFYQQHMVSAKALDQKIESADGMEYSEYGNMINRIASQLSDFLSMRVSTARTFSSEDGVTFKSLSQMTNDFVTYDLATYLAYIWENGIARNQKEEISLLSSVNHTLLQEYKKYTDESNMYQQVVSEYDNRMTTSVLIPTYDDKTEYYMARTKTGVDELSKSAMDRLASASTRKNTISQNLDKMSKLVSKPSQNQYETANRLCVELQTRLGELIRQTVLLDESYINVSSRSAIAFIKRKSSFLSQLRLKNVLIIAVAACALLYVYLVRINKRRLQKMIELSRVPMNATANRG